MSRRLAFAAGVVVILLGAWAFRRAAAPVEGDWVSVERGDLPLTVEVTGTLQASESTFLNPPQIPQVWEFKLAFLAPEGTEVAAGEPVLRFDTSELERRLLDRRGEEQEAAKELEKRTTDLAKQRQDLELRLAEAEVRQRRFEAQASVPEELVAAAELQKRALDLELARREVAYLAERLDFEQQRGEAELASLAERRDRAAARVRELEQQIERMTVRSPRSGTVVYVSRRGEEKPKVGDSVWQGRSLVEIPDLESMVAVGEVDEADAGRIAPGQSARLSLDALPGVQLQGRVAAVGNAVQRRHRRSPLKVVEVEMELVQGDTRRMRPGMRFRGELETERLEEVLTLPLAAVEVTAGGPRVTVRRGLGVGGWGVEAVEPRLGRQGDGRVEVLEGLVEGERVRVAAGPGGEP